MMNDEWAGPSQEPDAYTEHLKKVAFEGVMAAWQGYEECIALAETKQWEKLPERLQQTLEQALQSLNILYSASLEASAQPELLQHLLQTENDFTLCNSEFVEEYRYWQEHLDQALEQNKPSPRFYRYFRQTEMILAAIENYQHQLRHQLYYTAAEQQVFFRKKQWLSLIFGGLFLLMVGLYPVYLYLEPTVAYHQSGGQLFWKAPGMESFGEDHSLHFRIVEDGAFHEYEIRSFVPLHIQGLRLDPASEDRAEIVIDFIEYYEEGSETPIFEQDFHANPEGWEASQHVQHLSVKENQLHFRTTGPDPILVHPKLHFPKLQRIRLRMKVTLYKTYIQWLFS